MGLRTDLVFLIHVVLMFLSVTILLRCRASSGLFDCDVIGHWSCPIIPKLDICY